MKCRGFRAGLTPADRFRNPIRSRESRARAAFRPAAPSPIRQSRSRARASFRSSYHRRFQEFECAFPIRVQARLDAQRYCKQGPNGMPDRRTKHDGDAERPKNSRADLPDGWGSGHSRLAFWKVSQHNPPHSCKFSGLFQMHQDAIHLVGLHSAVLENQDRIFGVQFPRRPNRGLEQSHASAQNSAHRLTCEDRFTSQPQFPPAFRSAHRLKKGALVITLALTRTRVEPSGYHGAVERDPVTPLPQKYLQRCEVAESNHAFQIREALLQAELKKVIRSVAATQGDKSVDLIGIQGPKKTIGPLQGRPGKVHFCFAVLIGDDLKTVPLQLREPGNHCNGISGRGGCEYSKPRTGSECLWFSWSSIASVHS